jgi:hypothetical protein
VTGTTEPSIYPRLGGRPDVLTNTSELRLRPFTAAIVVSAVAVLLVT